MRHGLLDIIKDKKVLFITSKNIDYIRNTQEIRILREYAAELDLIYSDAKTYPGRIVSIWWSILKTSLKKYDVVFAGFAPQLIVPALKLKRNKQPLVIDFYISVFDTYVNDREKFARESIFAWISRRMDIYAIKYADHIIVDTMEDAAWFLNEFGGRRDRYEILYLEADSRYYYPRIQQKPEMYKDKYTVIYFGSILPLQGVETILETIRLLKDEKDLDIDMIGPVPEKYHKPIQDNVRYTRWLEQDILAERIAQADLCIAGHFSSTIEKASRTIPGKAYIFESMKKPMILGDTPANHELFKEDSCHYFCECGNAEQLAITILLRKKEWEKQRVKQDR